MFTHTILLYMYYYNTTLQQKFDKKKTSQSVALQIQRRIFFLQICLRMASCRLQSTNVNCHLKGLHNIYIYLTFHKRHLNFMSLSINLYFKSRFPSFLPFNSSNWGPAAARWIYSFVLCHRPETCVIVYVNRNHMGHFVLPVKKRGNSASK